MLAGRIGAHEITRPHRRSVAVARDGIQTPDDGVDIFIAIAVRVDHAADLEHLDFRCSRIRRQRGCRIYELGGAFRVRPFEHLEFIGIGGLSDRAGRADSGQHDRSDQLESLIFSHIRP